MNSVGLESFKGGFIMIFPLRLELFIEHLDLLVTSQYRLSNNYSLIIVTLFYSRSL